MKRFPKVAKKFPNNVKKFLNNVEKFPKDLESSPKITNSSTNLWKSSPKLSKSESCSRANLSKMNQNETNWPKIYEVDQDSENLVEQIEQNELWNLLKLPKIYQWDG